MEELGLALIDDSFRTLRRMIRDARSRGARVRARDPRLGRDPRAPRPRAPAALPLRRARALQRRARAAPGDPRGDPPLQQRAGDRPRALPLPRQLEHRGPRRARDADRQHDGLDRGGDRRRAERAPGGRARDRPPRREAAAADRASASPRGAARARPAPSPSPTRLDASRAAAPNHARTRPQRALPAAARGRAADRRGRQRAGGGTVARTSATHSSSGSSPAIRRRSASLTGASIPAPGERAREQRDRLERLDRLADPRRDLGRRHALREQLAGAAVAALRRERGRDEVAGAGQPDHRLRPRAEPLGVAPHLGEDVPGRGAGRVQPLRLGRAGRRARRRSSPRPPAPRRPGRSTARTRRPRG